MKRFTGKLSTLIRCGREDQQKSVVHPVHPARAVSSLATVSSSQCCLISSHYCKDWLRLTINSLVSEDTFIHALMFFFFNLYIMLHEIQRHLLLGRKAMTNLDSVLESRDITSLTKVHIVNAMVFL